MFGMGTGVSPSLWSPKTVGVRRGLTKLFESNTDGQQDNACSGMSRYLYPQSKFYGQAERAISSGKLNTLLHLHIRPINLVVFQGPS